MTAYENIAAEANSDTCPHSNPPARTCRMCMNDFLATRNPPDPPDPKYAAIERLAAENKDLYRQNKRLREALEKVSELIDSETPDVWYSADIAMVLAALAAPGA